MKRPPGFSTLKASDKGFPGPGHVPQAKRYGIGIEGIVLKGEFFGIGAYKLNLILGQTHLIGLDLSLIQHALVNVQHCALDILP
jgi:hypothetical protein